MLEKETLQLSYAHIIEIVTQTQTYLTQKHF